MKILLCPHTYLPHKIAGCEVYLNRLATYLLTKGYEIRCLVLYHDPYTINGVHCERVEHEKQWQDANSEAFEWADIVFTQLSGVPFAVNKCNQFNKRLLYIAHNANITTSFQYRQNNSWILYNSQQLADSLPFKQSSFVLPPPVSYRDFQKSNGKYITLINCNENKGGSILPQIARLLPQVQFLGVFGAYDEQIICDEPNVTYCPVTDIHMVLSQTAIILCPSLIETYGQVPIEAYSAGIPVIAHPTAGLKESMGSGGIFIDRSDIAAYAEKIVSLMNDSKAEREYALNRAKELDPENNLDNFNNWLESICR